MLSTFSRPIPSADPNTIRRAVEQFQQCRQARFQNLIPWRDDILALRDKGASGEAIADLLTQHGVRTSRSEPPLLLPCRLSR